MKTHSIKTFFIFFIFNLLLTNSQIISVDNKIDINVILKKINNKTDKEVDIKIKNSDQNDRNFEKCLEKKSSFDLKIKLSLNFIDQIEKNTVPISIDNKSYVLKVDYEKINDIYSLFIKLYKKKNLSDTLAKTAPPIAAASKEEYMLTLNLQGENFSQSCFKYKEISEQKKMIFKAIEQSSTESIKKLAQKINFCIKNDQGDTPLHTAIKKHISENNNNIMQTIGLLLSINPQLLTIADHNNITPFQLSIQAPEIYTKFKNMLT